MDFAVTIIIGYRDTWARLETFIYRQIGA